MRGKARSHAQLHNDTGITPACAGKSPHNPQHYCGQRDHPRVCGEKARTLIAWEEPQGSPPRVRGKAKTQYLPAPLTRITPACAGKSYTRTCYAYNVRDHPRVCGEKCQPGPRSPGWAGSPPRVRGKGHTAGMWAQGSRITPACAGKRLKRSHSIGHFSCILCLFHSVLHRASVSGGSRAGPCAPPCLPAQNAVPV